ncbi:MAG: manganese efflux pump [Ruminococcaceae bacterium]|nr:manganese efflux pump [Oscillospiraceae bacterium]
MDWNFTFFFNSILLGAGLAMDAFSVSMADGIREPKMSFGKMLGISGIFGIFQGLMPLIGWICIHTVIQYFQAFEVAIPWIALALLSYIGGKMLYEGIKSQSCPVVPAALGLGALLLQGVATSIDALSVGFTIASYDLLMAVVASAIIAVVTLAICLVGLYIGKKAGSCLSGKAGIVGGAILIFIGLEIFITSWF